jgi:hypothetical protein
MDTYSPEGDLQLEVGEPRPVHDLRTPGAWRWLAPLGLCVTFAGTLGISVFARPEPASIELPEPVPGMSAPSHVEPLAESWPQPPSPLAAEPTALAAAAVEEPQPPVVQRGGASQPSAQATPADHAEPEAQAAPEAAQAAPISAPASDDEDLPTVEQEDPEDSQEDPDGDDDAEDSEPEPEAEAEELSALDVDSPHDASEPALPGSAG